MRIPAEFLLREVRLSPEGSHLALIASVDDRFIVISADGTHSEYDHAGSLSVGPNGKTTVCLARDRGRVFVPVNGSCERAYDWAREPVLSPSGGSYAYWAMRRDRSPIIPGMEGYLPPAVIPGMEGYLLVHDATEIGPYREPGHWGFSSKDDALYYCAGDRSGSFVVSDGRCGPAFDFVTQPVVHPLDGAIWYWGRRSDNWSLMRWDTVIAESSTLAYEGGPFFSRDGHAFACWVCERDRWSILVDGRRIAVPGTPVDGSSEISVFAADNFAYSFADDANVFVVARGEVSSPMDGVGRVKFSRDGNRFGYLARVGERGLAVVDGERTGGFDVAADDIDYEAPNSWEHTVAFNGDGSSFAYPARRGDAECVVLNEEPERSFDALSGTPAFSPADDRLVYGCINNRKEYVDIGGERGDPYDRVWSPLLPGRSALWSPASIRSGDQLVLCVSMGTDILSIQI